VATALEQPGPAASSPATPTLAASAPRRPQAGEQPRRCPLLAAEVALGGDGEAPPRPLLGRGCPRGLAPTHQWPWLAQQQSAQAAGSSKPRSLLQDGPGWFRPTCRFRLKFPI
jgi:hypothetical protein